MKPAADRANTAATCANQPRHLPEQHLTAQQPCRLYSSQAQLCCCRISSTPCSPDTCCQHTTCALCCHALHIMPTRGSAHQRLRPLQRHAHRLHMHSADTADKHRSTTQVEGLPIERDSNTGPAQLLYPRRTVASRTPDYTIQSCSMFAWGVSFDTLLVDSFQLSKLSSRCTAVRPASPHSHMEHSAGECR